MMKTLTVIILTVSSVKLHDLKCLSSVNNVIGIGCNKVKESPSTIGGVHGKIGE